MAHGCAICPRGLTPEANYRRALCCGCKSADEKGRTYLCNNPEVGEEGQNCRLHFRAHRIYGRACDHYQNGQGQAIVTTVGGWFSPDSAPQALRDYLAEIEAATPKQAVS